MRLITTAACLPLLWTIALPVTAVTVDELRCEYRTDPVGIDVPKPRLSWILTSPQRHQLQTAYQVLVSSSPEKLADNEGDFWDSGRTASSESLHREYAGRPLLSRTRAWWKVRVWDQDGQPSAWSKPATWTMGLLNPTDWQASWIADPSAATNAPSRGPLNGYHSEITNRYDATKWVSLDLSQPQSIDAVQLFPARPYDWQPDTPGFLFPLRLKIECASQPDFSDAHLLVDRSTSDLPNPGTNASTFRFPATTARFLRLIVTKLARRDADNFAFALAEMEVLQGERNLAKGAPMTALDSIETGAWARTNLTDGVTVTGPPFGVPASAGSLPATTLRKSFTLSKPIRQATAYATALGLYELRLNGQPIRNSLLTPEWTNYRKRVHYQTYDVTNLLKPGENTLGASLGEGWYAGRLMAVGRFAYGTFPCLLLQLELEFTDGSKDVIVTDPSWRSTTAGPIRSSGIYDGEAYDARQEMPGWDQPGFDDRTWSPVKTIASDPRQLVWQPNEPIQVEMDLPAITLTEPRPGAYVFDLGQNMVGWCRISASGTAGKTVTIRHAEMLNDDGTLYTANLRGAPQIDRYTPRTDGSFVFEPHFTYQGFRYVELTGLSRPPARESVLGRVFHSSSPIVGRFECSDPSLNQLMQNIVWTARANLMSSPNDCPQRDERFGWMGDIQAFSQTAIFNMDLAAFFTKFSRDIRDDQADDGRFPDFAPHPGNPNRDFSGAPAWADAGTIVPWRAFQNYADLRLLSEHFESARRWVDYIHKLNPDLVWIKGRQNDYNDWLNGDWVKQQGWPNKGGSVPKEVFATAFFAHSTDLVSRMAEIIGRKAESESYRTLFTRIKQVFNQKFVQPDGRIEGDTQGGYALALNFDLLPLELRPKAAQHLVDSIRLYQGHLSTGIQTTHRAMLELTRYGYHDTAWQLLTNRSFPGWLYMIDNGATTIWERWDGYVKGRGFQDAGMNSFNHWAFGAVGEWMWRNIAGLNPDDSQPGWKHFTIAPRPGGGVNWAKAEYQSIRGPIACHWKIDHDQLTLQATVPANTTATLFLPTTDPSNLTESGKPTKPARTTPDCAVFELDSGTYEFISPFRQ